MHDEAEYVCQICGETIVIPLDASAGASQQYVEDCPVCCHPHILRVTLDVDGMPYVQAEHE